MMAMAKEKPPKRDHSKPFGLTWYKSLIQVCVYGAAVFVPIAIPGRHRVDVDVLVVAVTHVEHVRTWRREAARCACI